LVLEVLVTQVKEHQVVVLYSILLLLLVAVVVVLVQMVVQLVALVLLVVRVAAVVVLLTLLVALAAQVTRLLYLHHKAIVVEMAVRQVQDAVAVVEGVQVPLGVVAATLFQVTVEVDLLQQFLADQ
jgi:hypothetical protein